MTTMKMRRAACRHGIRAARAMSERERALLLRERALRLAQAALARMTQLAIVAELATAMAHEVNQPLTAIAANGEACLRWIDRPAPNLDEARAAVERMLAAGQRASAVLRHLRQRGEVHRRKPGPGPVALATAADAMQLQQLLIKLLMHGIDDETA